MNSGTIRTKFFDFFKQKGHTVVPSSPVIPADDPTLLFTNAGMNQFKDVFLGRQQQSFTRAVSIQKCIRAGGKHNDLDNVGFTSRHLTFFEMMGNFSFGNYFKKEAIQYAWEFLTDTLKIDSTQLYVSVFEKDAEAYELWRDTVGVPADKIIRLGAKDNFWQMGDTGPCGPCTEIYIDRGLRFGCGSATCAPGCSCDRFLEIWNLVFMQFNRQADHTDVPLRQTGVDTGMGLERLCTVMQQVPSVFDTDFFAPIIQEIERLTGVSYATSEPAIQSAFKVLADHIRSTSCAIADGGVPAADGRGYVIRKIIRRAALFATKISPEPFFPQLVNGVIASLGSIYPELTEQKQNIIAILQQETEQFSRNLLRGKSVLEHHFTATKPHAPISGTLAFTLYDTYGFPLELTNVIAQEHGVTVDTEGFEKEMEAQRLKSAAKEEGEVQLAVDPACTTEFTGYHALETSTVIKALFVEGKSVDRVPSGTACWIVPEASPFYVAGGGQVSDEGTVTVGQQTVPLQGLLKQGSARAVKCVAPAELRCGDTVLLRVNKNKRFDCMKNHTATHLLQSALIKTLGSQVKQSGSLVAPEYLRFDFTYHEQPTPAQISAVELLVNNAIQENIPLQITTTTLQNAKNQGVIAFFGEKYNPESVRVVAVPPISAELCGGTHVRATGDIGFFKITEVSSLAAGTRRIVAYTGSHAVALAQKQATTLKALSLAAKVPEAEIGTFIEKQRDSIKELQQHAKRLKKELWQLQIPHWLAQASEHKGIAYHIILIEQATIEELRELANLLATKKAGIWCTIATEAHHEQIKFVVAVTPSLKKQFNLKTLAPVLEEIGMRGGGSDAVIQGGAERLPETVARQLATWIDQKVAGGH